MTTALSSHARLVSYMAAASLLALSQGLGQGFISANLPQLAGDLGVSVTDASWLMVVYMAPRASLPLILSKMRSHYGLRRFAMVGAALHALMALAACFITDFHSALVVSFLMGCAAAPISTLAFLYMLELLPRAQKLVIGLPTALAVIMAGPNLARVLSPWLLGDGSFVAIHLFSLGLSLLSLLLVHRLPLVQTPPEKALVPIDFVTFALIASGFGGLVCALVLGPIYWWMSEPWIGLVLAGAVLALTLAILIELSRRTPMIDFRWLASPAMLQMMAAMMIFRLLLSERSSGAPRMFQVLGHGPDQLVVVFALITIVTLIAPLAYLAWFRPGREPWFHVVALLAIAAGALLDTASTSVTIPVDFALSQVLVSLAGMLFMPAAMIMGLMSALRRGPSYLLSFIIVFLATQSLGGVLGGGLFTTLTNSRQAVHFTELAEQLTAGAPQVQARIATRMAELAAQTPDAVAARAQAVASLVEEASRQAWVMAYNDAYLVTTLLALLALSLLSLRMLHDHLRLRMTPPAPVATPET